MDWLVDTGVLLRCFHPVDSLYEEIKSALKKLRSQGDGLFITVQNAGEFWNASTRPVSARGGYGQGVAVTERRLRFIESYTEVLPIDLETYEAWKGLVSSLSITGVNVHDARLVASMKVNSLTHLITLDGGFGKYVGIKAVRPSELI